MGKIIMLLTIVSCWALFLSFVYFLNDAEGNYEIGFFEKKWSKEFKKKDRKYNIIATVVVVLLCAIQIIDYLNIFN